jgi:hypothetical protein
LALLCVNEPQAAAVADDRHLQLAGLMGFGMANFPLLRAPFLFLLDESLVERKHGGIEEGVHALLDLLLGLAAGRPEVVRIGEVCRLRGDAREEKE